MFLKKNALRAIQRSIYYPTCSEELQSHFCDPCDDGELGGVRSVFYYQDGVFALTNAPSKSEFDAGIAAGTVIIIPSTRGSYDGGSPTYDKGFGDTDQSYSSSTYKLTYIDPNYVKNRDFYNSLQSQTQWKIGWRSETQIHLSEKTVTAYGKDTHEEDVKTKVYWNVEVSWVSKIKPLIYDTPASVFECFQVINP